MLMAKAEASTIVLNLADEELAGLPVSQETLMGLLNQATKASPGIGLPLNAVLLATAKIVQHNDAVRKALRKAILPGKWYKIEYYICTLH